MFPKMPSKDRFDIKNLNTINNMDKKEHFCLNL